jgi:hypothetical protein
MNKLCWSEVFFAELISERDNWLKEECSYTSASLLSVAKSSNWLKAALTKDVNFLKHKNDLCQLSPSYILDKVFGIDFLVTFELENEVYTYGIDVTSNKDAFENKLYKANSASRKQIRSKLGLDGFLVVGISLAFDFYSACSKRELNYIAACIEQAVVTGKSSVWVEK